MKRTDDIIEQQWCRRCDHKWFPRTPIPPIHCPKCNNRNWQQPSKYKVLKIGQ